MENLTLDQLKIMLDCLQMQKDWYETKSYGELCDFLDCMQAVKSEIADKELDKTRPLNF